MIIYKQLKLIKAAVTVVVVREEIRENVENHVERNHEAKWLRFLKCFPFFLLPNLSMDVYECYNALYHGTRVWLVIIKR